MASTGLLDHAQNNNNSGHARPVHGKKIKRGNMYYFGNFKIVVFGGGMILKLRVRTFSDRQSTYLTQIRPNQVSECSNSKFKNHSPTKKH